MTAKHSVTKTLYGNVSIDRMMCPDCEEVAFVIRGRMACCDLEVETKARRITRMSEPLYVRKQPSSDEKLRILAEQNHRCFWCEGDFGSLAQRVGKSIRIVKLMPCWDHVQPFAWSANNSPLNFVASCSICNGIKSSKMYPTIEDTRRYIIERRTKKNWSNL